MKLSPEEVLATAKINPELDAILKKMPPLKTMGPNPDMVTVRAALSARKQQMKAAAAAKGEEQTTYTEEDIQIAVRDGASIDIRIHKPKTVPEDGCPIFIMYHGGGYCFGDLDSEEFLCRTFTSLGGIAINVAYRLAPENPFPAGTNDAYDALKWTSTHYQEFGGNPSKGFLIGGCSAGANLAAISSIQYKDENLSPQITGCYLSIPTVLSDNLVPEKYKDVFLSREQNKDAPILNQESIKSFGNLYKADPTSKLRSPLMWRIQNGFPAAYIQACGLDPIRDDALIYERILSEDNGVKTKLDLFPGLPHGFWGWFTQASFTKEFQKDCVKGLEWLLEQSK